MPMLLKRTFSAWIDRMPSKKPRLIVTGKVETPTSGWSGSLVRVAPQGTTAKILLLDAHLTGPTGPTNPKICQIDLRYEEMPAAGHARVTVRLNGSEVTLDVDGAQ
jgi:hypothetical protein